MQVGVIITNGIQDWQIVQQRNDYGQIDLEGVYFPNQSDNCNEVYVRIVDENTADVIIPWKCAELLEGNHWKCTLKNVPAGGLYRLETALKAQKQSVLEWAVRGDVVNHIGVGDVYVIAGQSNAAGYGKDPVYDPPELGVHVFKNSDKWDMASHPLNDSTKTKHLVNLEYANSGHSPYLSFAKYIKRKTGYPIGLIQSSLGGSGLELWNPDERGLLYQNMLERVQSQCKSIRGILWYQGCSDTTDEQSATYLSRFMNMVKHIRQDLSDPDLPVYTFQIGRNTAPDAKSVNEYWSRVREAQRAAAREHRIYVLPTLDGTLSDEIHNSATFNIVLGERLAKLVLHTNYKKAMFAYAPDLERAEVCDRKTVKLTFTHVYDRLITYSAAPDKLAFIVEDNIGVNPIRSYKIADGNIIYLYLEREIETGCLVSSAYGSNPEERLPVDFANHYPILAFHRVPVR